MKTNYFFIKTAFLFFFLVSQNFNAQCTYTVTKVTPYLESFSSVTTNNQLPNCWLSSNPSVTCLTYTSVANNGPYAAFFDTPTGVNYFYSEGLYLVSGITYSANIWYKTDNTGGTNWTNLSLLYGTTQSATGLVSIASTSGAANSAVYTSLSNTFVVSSTGIYYISLRGTSTTGTSHYLNFDDLLVNVPCALGNNTPSITITTNTSSICSGDPLSALSLTASGAGTYSWNTGAITPTINGSFNLTAYYEVVGTSTLSYCTATLSKLITVLQSPTVLLYVAAPDVCLGHTVSLGVTPAGGTTYSWSTGASGTQIAVSPINNTIYSVVGTSTNGCSSSAAQMINVHPLPTIAASVSPSIVCKSDSVIIVASGGVTYTFTEPGGITTMTNNFNVTPTVSATYSLTGKDANGCANTATVFLLVNDCTGLKAFSNESTFSLYPNPNKGEFVINASSFKGENTKVIVYSAVGQKIMEQNLTDEKTFIKTNLSAGLYYYEVLNSGQKITSGKLVLEE